MYIFNTTLPTDKLKKDLSKYENNIEFLNLFNLFVNLCLDTFEWEGLPKTCDARMLELNLLYRGTACLYRDENGNIWSYGAGIGGRLTRYGMPDKGFAYALNGINVQCKYYWDGMDNTGANAVLCMDNKMFYPYINYIVRAADTISDAKRSMQTAARANKISYIMACSEEQKKSLLNVYNNIQNNDVAIIINKDNEFMQPQAFSTNVQSGMISEFWEYYMNLYNDFKDILGINSNKQSDKKERLIISEVLGDQEFVENNLEFRLEERKLFAERCNKFLGTNISVKLKNKENDLLSNSMMKGSEEDDKAIQ